MLLSGCSEPALFRADAGEFALLESTVGRIDNAVAGIEVDLGELRQQAGRDINEPWTGRILAMGAAAFPACGLALLVYAWSKRTRLYAWLAGIRSGQ